MKNLPLGMVAALLMWPAAMGAQLAPPSAAGLSFNHVHLNVADVELNKALWSELRANSNTCWDDWGA